MKRPLIFLAVLLLAGCAVIARGYWNATREPIMREATLALRDWPAEMPPMRVAVLSDLHVAGPDMPPERLARVVQQVNATRPDLILLAGDFTSTKSVATRIYTETEAAAPLAALRARLGVLAVLGNHDYWRNGRTMERALQQVGVQVLHNEAVSRGGLVIGGADDIYTRHLWLNRVTVQAERLPGPALLMSHGPDVMKRLGSRFRVVVTGHTHCGQISLPFYGPLSTASASGRRYACGLVRDPDRTVVIGAGIGTSIVPLRYGAPPDWWLLTLRGPAGQAAEAR